MRVPIEELKELAQEAYDDYYCGGMLRREFISLDKDIQAKWIGVVAFLFGSFERRYLRGINSERLERERAREEEFAKVQAERDRLRGLAAAKGEAEDAPDLCRNCKIPLNPALPQTCCGLCMACSDEIYGEDEDE